MRDTVYRGPPALKELLDFLKERELVGNETDEEMVKKMVRAAVLYARGEDMEEAFKVAGLTLNEAVASTVVSIDRRLRHTYPDYSHIEETLASS